MIRRNVLIFNAGALGDFVLSWPLGLAMGRLFPQSRVIYITQRQKGALVEKALRLEAMDVEGGWHHLFGDAGKLPDACRNRLLGAHTIMTFVARPGDAWCQAVAKIAPEARVVCVESRPEENTEGEPAAQYLLKSLVEMPALQAAGQQLLASVAANGVSAAKHDEAGPIAIHPGSGSREKCWPIDSYLKLVDRIHADGRHCKILLGEVEMEKWSAADIRRLDSSTEAAHPATYIDLFAELSRSCAFVGNDSGPGHLAGVLGLPTTSLFGPTDPKIWKPLGPAVTVLRHEPLADLSVDEVYQAVLAGLGKNRRLANTIDD